MIQLFCELNAGIRSAEEEGWVSEEEMREHFHRRRKRKSELRSPVFAFCPEGYR